MRKGDFTTLGATAHSEEEREENDFYATDPKALELFLDQTGIELRNVWECACGEGHLSKVFESKGYNVRSSDLMDRGFGEIETDFLGIDNLEWNGDVITNPPYKYAQEFVEKALQIIPNGNKVAMFLKLQFMEGKGRKNLFLKNPPKTIYVSSSRLMCAKNAEFEKMVAGGGSAVAYAWYLWEKGFVGTTELKWFN